MAIFNFLKNSKGATAIEYAILAGLISIIILGAVLAVGKNSAENYTGVADKVSGAMNSAP